MPTFEIDGSRFSTLEEFYDEVHRVLIPLASWGRNLDAFNDILRGGFGTPEVGFEIRWKDHQLSRNRLGRKLFETLVGIIETHGPGGMEAEDGVTLRLA
jgi:RNAse (barnase) inhibitor barstar